MALCRSKKSATALRTLALEYRGLQEEPVEGFRVRLIDEDDLFSWEVIIFGPPETLYHGAYFKAKMRFPSDYPYSPPTLRFKTKVWHPNVYENGDLCISILHPPIEDPHSGELASERWNPTQSVRTILLSVISLLNEPNTSSPANVDASVMYRRWKDSDGADKEYENIVRRQVMHTMKEAEKDGIIIPLTVEDYCVKNTNKKDDDDLPVDLTEFYEETYDYDDDDDDDEEEEEVKDDDSTLETNNNTDNAQNA